MATATSPGVHVAPNPMVAATAHQGNTERQSRVSMVQTRAVQGIITATTAVKDKPYQSTAVILSAISLAFLIIGCLAPWWEYRSDDISGGGNTFHVHGHASLFDYKACTTIDDNKASQYGASASCTIVWLRNCAISLNYMYRAGAATFAMLVFAIITGAFAFYMTYQRRIGNVDNSLPHWLGFLKPPVATPVLHGVTGLFAMIAFSVWAGLYNANMGDDTLSSFSILSAKKQLHYNLSGGFAIVVIAFIFELACGVLTFFFAHEASTGAGNKPGVHAATDAFRTAAMNASVAYDATSPGQGQGVSPPGMPPHSYAPGQTTYDPSKMNDVAI